MELKYLLYICPIKIKTMKKKEIFNLVSDLLTKYTQSGLPTFEGQTTIINSNGFLKELHENLLISAEKWFIEITSNVIKIKEDNVINWTRNGKSILRQTNYLMLIRPTDWDLITEEGEFETPQETQAFLKHMFKKHYNLDVTPKMSNKLD